MKTFNDKSRAKTKEGKDKKWNTFDILNALYEGRKLTLNAFWSGIFSIRKTTRKIRKIIKNIKSQTNASKIANSPGTSKSR